MRTFPEDDDSRLQHCADSQRMDGGDHRQADRYPFAARSRGSWVKRWISARWPHKSIRVTTRIRGTRPAWTPGASCSGCRGRSPLPRSTQDVVEIVRWANRTGTSLALRGKGHTQAGQSLTCGGVQIDMQGLDRIGPVDERRRTLRVQAGATWRAVVGHLGPRGWMPMVLTNNLDTTVGGTLSTGGVGLSSHLYGTQANNVDELEAVTGDGRLLRCSATENTSLFDATRAGLGQFSIITEARIRIRRVQSRVRTFRLVYEDLADPDARSGADPVAPAVPLFARLVPAPGRALHRGG